MPDAALVGSYVFTDSCSGEISALRPTNDAWEVRVLDKLVSTPVAFGESPDGELVIVSLTDGIFQLTGASS